MTDPALRLSAAEAAESVAKARFDATLAALKHRLEPARLADDAKREAAEVGQAARRRTVAAAKRHPAWVAGAAALASLFLARRRIAALFRRRRATDDDDAS